MSGLSGGFISSVVVDGNRVIVGDRGSFSDPTAAGLKFYDVEAGMLIGEPIDTGLPPASIVPLRNVATAIVATSDVTPSSSALEAVYPNPFNATVQIPFHTTGSEVDVAIFSLLGQRVRSLVSGSLAAGSYRLSWDGLTDTGVRAASGTYVVQMLEGGERHTQKLTLLQ